MKRYKYDEYTYAMCTNVLNFFVFLNAIIFELQNTKKYPSLTHLKK